MKRQHYRTKITPTTTSTSTSLSVAVTTAKYTHTHYTSNIYLAEEGVVWIWFAQGDKTIPKRSVLNLFVLAWSVKANSIVATKEKK